MITINKKIDFRMMSMKRIVLMIMVALVGGMQQSCNTTAEATATTKQEEVVKVKTSKITPTEVDITKSYYGKANYHKSMTYLAEMAGQVLKANVKSGDYIHKGDTLFAYPPINHELQIEQARLTYKEMKDTYERKEKLFKIGAVARVELKSAKTSMDVQKKVLERLQKQNVIIAPFSGIVTDVFVHQNEEVEVDDKICSIANTGQLKLSFYVPLKEIDLIHLGHPVSITYNGQTVKGSISQKAVQMDPQKRLFHVEATFADAKDFSGAGATFKVNVVTDTRAYAILIPNNATTKKRDGYYAYFVKDNKAEIRKVNYKHMIGMDFLVERGVNRGDVLIVNGVDKVSDGQSVIVVK
ncbi:efflux RND transporter periplasmic adaptor subunit [Puteibacter caeruleilacunae]|nr:efflux RND transporter periplasmic adaptor subunit [Puteibacter caeruleilacunae]